MDAGRRPFELQRNESQLISFLDKLKLIKNVGQIPKNSTKTIINYHKTAKRTDPSQPFWFRKQSAVNLDYLSNSSLKHFKFFFIQH